MIPLGPLIVLGAAVKAAAIAGYLFLKGKRPEDAFQDEGDGAIKDTKNTPSCPPGGCGDGGCGSADCTPQGCDKPECCKKSRNPPVSDDHKGTPL